MSADPPASLLSTPSYVASSPASPSPLLPSSSNNNNNKPQKQKAYFGALVSVGILLTIAHQRPVLQDLFSGLGAADANTRTLLRGGGNEDESLLEMEDEVIDTNHTASSTLSPQEWKELLLPQVDPMANYTWHSIPQKQPLNFVHIPKTGGSSMVRAGIQAGLNWGDCLFQYQWPGRTCPDKPVQVWKPDQSGMGRVWWHVPIQHLPLKELGMKNPYLGKDLFAVIRNPYERAVSEFFYHCSVFPNTCVGLKNPNNHMKNIRMLNQHIQLALKTVIGARGGTEDYFFHWGHWIPQYHYFYKKTTGQRMVHHLLHTELLVEELPSLLGAYDLQDKVQLSTNKVKQRGEEAQELGVPQLTQTTLKLIEVVYERDFVLGGYRMISSNEGYNNNGGGVATTTTLQQ